MCLCVWVTAVACQQSETAMAIRPWDPSSLIRELRHCVKVKVDVLGSPSLIVHTVSLDMNQHCTWTPVPDAFTSLTKSNFCCCSWFYFCCSCFLFPPPPPPHIPPLQVTRSSMILKLDTIQKSMPEYLKYSNWILYEGVFKILTMDARQKSGPVSSK